MTHYLVRCQEKKLDERRTQYEKLREELFEITFTHSVEEYDPKRVREIVNEMEELFPTPEPECKISEGEYLSMLEELFNQEMEEDEELIGDSDFEYIKFIITHN